jgi:predicted O-methyltransferase YrrM
MGLWGRVRAVIGQGRAPSHAPQAFPAGAFYSPVVHTGEVLAPPDRDRIWPAEPDDPAGLDVRADAQLALLEELGAHRFDPGVDRGTAAYDPANDQFPPQDAALLYAMVRHLRPRRMIEVGSGWSTTVTAAAIGDGELGTELTCIEPYPRDFLRTMADRLTLREEKVEHAPLTMFEGLEAGDVLFIDSSHVVKTGSDVVHQLLEVVPRLADGVVVHVHDVFIPQDYPQGWVRAGFGWNEQYLVQAYLVGNARAHVLAMNRWLALRHPEALARAFGPMAHDGSSLWFRTGPAPVTR